MTKDELESDDEVQKAPNSLGLRSLATASFVIRHSSFVIPLGSPCRLSAKGLR